MSNKIKAAIRVRPFLPSEKKQGFKNSLLQINQDKHQITVKEESSQVRKFHFDYLFGHSAGQDDVYKQCRIENMIDKAIEGYHSTIFAYGQTGSGKTFTMQGSQTIEDGSNSHIDGIIPKVIKDLFRKVQALSSRRTFSITVSFLQIYNQKIFDLLNPSSLNNKNLSSNINGLRLRWNKDEQFSVENLFVFQCKNQEELMKFFLYGLKNRISSSHRLNMQSSRSHSILTIRIESFDNEDPGIVLASKIELVDLAGSERIGMTGTQGRLAKESIDINKSLFTLRQVISILSEASKTKGKEKVHVPYRDSKLTSILKQSIGGNSYSLMIACLNPNDTFLEENISTLTYATKASYITNQPVINDDPRNKLINQLKKQVKQLNQQLGKANQHIQFMTSLNNELNTTQRQNSVRMNQTSHSFNQGFRTTMNQGPAQNNMTTMSPNKRNNMNEENDNDNDMPVPMFKKRFSQKVNSNYGEFSERLIQSINMVRELLKSNKQLREQLQVNNKELQHKNLEIYELTRQNQMLREKAETNSTFYVPQKEISQNNDVPFELYESQRPKSNFKPRSTLGQSSNNIYGLGINVPNTTTKLSQSRGNFNNWNSVQINQFYMNQRGIDSQPTNFNKRQINTAQQRRNLPNSRGKSSDSQRHAITAKISTRRNWISKHSQPKKFLSFYNQPQRDPQLY